MARRPVVDREEVFEAANRLAAEGREVTALTLLDSLGGGSLTTIYKYLNAWNAERPAQTVASNNEIPDSVQAALASTWRAATQEAAKEVAAAKEKAAEEVQQAQKQFTDALAVIEKLEAESEADGQQIEELKAQVSGLESELGKAKNESAALKAAADELRQQIKKLEEAGKSDRAERDAALKEAAELRGLAEGLKTQNADLLARLAGEGKGEKRRS